MALATYTVKRGDSLWAICSGSRGTNVSNSISGNTINAKINTLVSLNGIRNPNLIYVGQVLKLSGSASSSNTAASTISNKATLHGPYLETTDTNGKTAYAYWEYSRAHLARFRYKWGYFANGHWINATEGETSSADYRDCYSSYTAPDNARQVVFDVLPISETYGDNDTPYWTDVVWAEGTYNFDSNPPMMPSVPDTPVVDNNQLTLTVSINNIDAQKLNADSVDFNIIKNNSSSIGTFNAAINKTAYHVEYVHKNLEVGSEYKVRARTKRANLYSAWTDFTSNVGTKPSKPSAITTCRTNSYEDESVTVYLEWTAVSNAVTYDIEYTTNIAYFDGSDKTTVISNIEFTHYEITSLELGKEYFFRVRAVNTHGQSDWSSIVSVAVGKTPIAPTTWSSTTKAVVGEPLNLYWVHNVEDGSRQTFADFELRVDDQVVVSDIITNTTEESEETKSYGTVVKKDGNMYIKLDTSTFSEGAKLKWRVRTAGVTDTLGDWSILRAIDVYAKPNLDLSVTTKPDGTGEIITTLTSYPFYIHALAGPSTQCPIGYHLKVTSNEYYETVDDVGNTKMVNKGDAIYSKYFDTSDVLVVEMSASNIDIEANIEYTITCSVTMNSGLTAETSHEFTADWEQTEYNLDASVTIDLETLTASIRPYSVDSEGSRSEDSTLSVYRREFDGSFVEIGKDIPNTNNTTVSDPHPALDYARYRIVGKTISSGAVSYYDLPGYAVGGKSVVIQWNEDWSVFDSSDEYSVEKPSWSGSMLTLPYNIDVSDNRSPDVSLVEYIGRKHPVSYYGTQVGETATWNVNIEKSDTNTIYALRRLSLWMDDVYVREPSGSGYWAHITVSFSQKHCDLVIPVTLSITRVEGGV